MSHLSTATPQSPPHTLTPSIFLNAPFFPNHLFDKYLSILHHLNASDVRLFMQWSVAQMYEAFYHNGGTLGDELETEMSQWMQRNQCESLLKWYEEHTGAPTGMMPARRDTHATHASASSRLLSLNILDEDIFDEAYEERQQQTSRKRKRSESQQDTTHPRTRAPPGNSTTSSPQIPPTTRTTTTSKTSLLFQYLTLVKMHLLRSNATPQLSLSERFIYDNFPKRPPVKTGCMIVDEWDVFTYGFITEVFGAPGTGKTQFCLSAAVRLAAYPSQGGFGTVIYLDTTSNYNQRRMKQIYAQHQKMNKNALDFEHTLNKIKVHRIMQYEAFIQYLDRVIHMLEVARRTKARLQGTTSTQFYTRLGMLVVDSLAPLLLTMTSTQRKIDFFLRDVFKRLRLIASYDVCVVFTNFTVSSGENPNRPKAALGDTLHTYIPHRMELMKNQEGSSIVRLVRFSTVHVSNLQTQFEISTRGIRNPKKNVAGAANDQGDLSLLTQEVYDPTGGDSLYGTFTQFT